MLVMSSARLNRVSKPSFAILATCVVAACKSESSVADAGASTTTPMTTPMTTSVAASSATATPAAASKGGIATVEDARAFLKGFFSSAGDRQALTRSLIPTNEQCEGIFSNKDVAKKACANFFAHDAKDLQSKSIGPRGEQSELLVFASTTDELRANTGSASSFPGGYRKIAADLKPGLQVFAWKFAKPGAKSGMAFDGLYHVDGKWFLVSHPWRALRTHTGPIGDDVF